MPTQLATYNAQQLRAVMRSIWRHRRAIDGYPAFDVSKLHATAPRTASVLCAAMDRLKEYTLY